MEQKKHIEPSDITTHKMGFGQPAVGWKYASLVHEFYHMREEVRFIVILKVNSFLFSLFCAYLCFLFF